MLIRFLCDRKAKGTRRVGNLFLVLSRMNGVSDTRLYVPTVIWLSARVGKLSWRCRRTLRGPRLIGSTR